ncbi:hypothetical protein VaNZ11_010630 [Volvox africanus]|uniref:Uncharacterized protein n=1 Tax=Volvox africanus TaxID=51714 RepID=A0ABQ5SAW1_9CHLO|nr:hypothetical protein VaNZ11_010630 [Volvox africanus]
MSNNGNDLAGSFVVSVANCIAPSTGAGNAPSRNGRTKEAGQSDGALSPRSAYRNIRVVDIFRRKATSSVRFRRPAGPKLSSAPANLPVAPPLASPYEAAAARQRARSKFNLGSSPPAKEGSSGRPQHHHRTTSSSRTQGSNAAGRGGHSFALARISGGGEASGTGFSFLNGGGNDDGDDDDENYDFDYEDDIINVPMERVLEQLDAERARLKCIDRGMGTLVDSVLAARTRTAHVSNIIQRTLRRRGPSLNLTKIPVEISPKCRTMVPRLDILKVNIPEPASEPEEVAEDAGALVLDFYDKHGETFQWRPAKRSTILQRVNAVAVLTPAWLNPSPTQTPPRGSIGPKCIQLNTAIIRPSASPRELTPFKIGTPRGYTPRSSAASPTPEPLSPKPRRVSARYFSHARARRVSEAKKPAAAGPVVGRTGSFRSGQRQRQRQMFGFGSSNGREVRLRDDGGRGGASHGGGASGSESDTCRLLSTKSPSARKTKTPVRACERTLSRSRARGRGSPSPAATGEGRQICKEVDGMIWLAAAAANVNASTDGGRDKTTKAAAATAAATAVAVSDSPSFATDGAELHPQDSSSAVQYGKYLVLKRSLSERLSSDFCGVPSAFGEGNGGDDDNSDRTALLQGKPEEVLKSINSMLTDIQATNTQLNPYIPSFIADTLSRASKVTPQPLAITLSNIAGLRPSLQWSTCTSANGRSSTAAPAALAVQKSNAWADNGPLDAGGSESEGGGGGGGDDGTSTASHEPCSSSLVYLAKELQPLHRHVMRTRTRRGSSPGVPSSAVPVADLGGDDGGGTAASHTSRFRKGQGGLSPSLSRQREQLQPPEGGGGGSGRDFGGDFGAAVAGDDGRVDHTGAYSSSRSLLNRDMFPRLSSCSPGASRRCSTDRAPAAAAAAGLASGFRSPPPPPFTTSPLSHATPTGSAANSPPRGPAFCYDIPPQPSGPLWSRLPSPDPQSKSPWFHHQNWNTNAVVLRPGSALLRAGASSPTRTPPTSPVPWLGPSERRQ